MALNQTKKRLEREAAAREFKKAKAEEKPAAPAPAPTRRRAN